jgi:hypothetical protein
MKSLACTLVCIMALAFAALAVTPVPKGVGVTLSASKAKAVIAVTGTAPVQINKQITLESTDAALNVPSTSRAEVIKRNWFYESIATPAEPVPPFYQPFARLEGYRSAIEKPPAVFGRSGTSS